MPGKIYICEASSTRRMLLKTFLSEAYYDVETLDCIRDLFDLQGREQPDLLICDLSRDASNGFADLKALKAHPDFAELPLIGTGSLTFKNQLRALSAGADDIFGLPLKEEVLVARARLLIRNKHTLDELIMRDVTGRELGLISEAAPVASRAPLKLLVAIDKCDEIVRWSKIISADHPKTHFRMVGSLAEAEQELKTFVPDAIVVGRKLPGGTSGLKFVAGLRRRESLRYVPVLSIVESDAEGVTALGPDVGANDYVVAPFDEQELAIRTHVQLRRGARTQAMRHQVRDGLMLAVTDPLTGFYNRRYMMTHLPKLLVQAKASNLPFSVMMLDLDKFKMINDMHGHPAGDAVLRELADRIRQVLREVDLLARIGGEEFFVALPGAYISDTAQIAERIRHAVADRPFLMDRFEQGLRATISVGVAIVNPGELEAARIVDRADRALYACKHAGRNCVRFDEAAVA